VTGVFRDRPTGFYFAAFAGVTAIAAITRYATWAPAHDGVNVLILAALAIGLVMNAILVIHDNDYLVIAVSACYSIALFQLLADSVGSFVDAFQGINLFGDATQVGTILFISCIMAASVVASISASFMTRAKE
jgi:hypothetical protein